MRRKTGWNAQRGWGASQAKAKIYGVSWDKGSNPTLTRTDAAVGMVAEPGKSEIYGVFWDKGASPTMVRTDDLPGGVL